VGGDGVMSIPYSHVQSCLTTLPTAKHFSNFFHTKQNTGKYQTGLPTQTEKNPLKTPDISQKIP
jgi:hypothetical protein